MMAVIMATFPGMTPEWLLWKCSFEQFFLWHDRAIERVTGEKIDRKSADPKKIKRGWLWTQERGWHKADG
jgi:hypothetical protein